MGSGMAPPPTIHPSTAAARKPVGLAAENRLNDRRTQHPQQASAVPKAATEDVLNMPSLGAFDRRSTLTAD